jgi:hypothetical protein
MTFFHDLNKRLAALASKQDARQIAEDAKATAPKSKLAESMDVAEAGYSAKAGRAGKDLGKPGKNFAKIAAKSGGGEKGQRIAGAVLNKLRHPKESAEQGDVMDYLNTELKDFDAQQQTKEGNAFSGAVAKAKADGIQKGEKINVGGKTYPVKEAGKPMTPKQKSFAKLAPPADKITFADKIAGAKKEVDEMLGDVAAEAIKSAIGKKKESRGAGTAFDPAVARQMFANKDEHPRYDVKDTGYSKRYTRKVQDEPTDDAETTDAPRGRGRPKGAPKGPERTTKGAWKHKGDRQVADEGQEHVCEMCGQTIAEKAKSKAQQKFMGMVHATQKGEKAPSKEVAKVAKEMPKKAAKDFASTKHKGLPKHVEEESTDKEDQKAEKAGKKVAKDIEHDEGHKGKDDNRAEKAGKKVTKDIEYDDKKDRKEKEEKVDETSNSSKGMQFGKGVYEGLSNKLEALMESMSVNISVDDQGKKSISVNATDDDAEALATLLKMAGVAGAPAQESCSTCGSADCECGEMVDENSPDWPTNTETLDAEPNLRTYSGGLNGPKSTGQTTVPVVASQARRQTSMEESVELERTLFKTWKNYKG